MCSQNSCPVMSSEWINMCLDAPQLCFRLVTDKKEGDLLRNPSADSGGSVVERHMVEYCPMSYLEPM
jgi:hypothetical protein